jgi:hypothetical protein
MNTWVEAPPRRKGLGCFARGCLIFLVFAIVLGIACVGGVFWGLHRHSALFYGTYWLAKTRSLAEAPVAVPEFTGSDQQLQAVQERWQEFEQKARAAQPAEIELTADDINSMIAASRDLRGKIFVSIIGSEVRVQTSVPLGEFLGRPGYYFNSNIVFNSKGAQSLDNLQLDRLTINGEQAPRDVLNWKYRSRRLRDYVADFLDTHNIGTVEVRDSKVTLRSRME